MDQGGDGGGGDKCLHWGCVLNSELTGFLSEMGMAWEGRSRGKCDAKMRSLSSGEDRRPHTEVHVQELMTDCHMTNPFSF